MDLVSLLGYAHFSPFKENPYLDIHTPSGLIDMKNKSGVYTITNTIDNKVYVGYSSDIPKRFKEHQWALLNNRHVNMHLQNAWNRDGEQHFKFELLETYSVHYLLAMEHYWCNMLNTHDRKFGYNILPTHPSKIAYTHSKESRVKISNGNKGRVLTKEHIEKIASQRRGKPSNRLGVKLSDETRERLKDSHVGNKHSEETKRKMSASRLGKTLNINENAQANRKVQFSTIRHIAFFPENIIKRSKKILQYTLGEVFLKETTMYELKQEGFKKIKFITKSSGKRFTKSKGYLWKYKS